jgi:hypothetical protein
MYIDYVELRALRDELRTYFAKLMTTELVAELSAGGGCAPSTPRALQEDGQGRLARESAGPRGTGPLEQFYPPTRSSGRLPAAVLTLNTVGRP